MGKESRGEAGGWEERRQRAASYQGGRWGGVAPSGPKKPSQPQSRTQQWHVVPAVELGLTQRMSQPANELGVPGTPSTVSAPPKQPGPQQGQLGGAAGLLRRARPAGQLPAWARPVTSCWPAGLLATLCPAASGLGRACQRASHGCVPTTPAVTTLCSPGWHISPVASLHLDAGG